MSSSLVAASISVQTFPNDDSTFSLKDLRNIWRAYQASASSGLRAGEIEREDGNEPHFTSSEQSESHNAGGVDTSIRLAEESVSDLEDNDLTPLEYARLHGLSRNHLSESFAFSQIKALRTSGSEDDVDKLLPQFDLGVEPRLDERLMLSRDAARLLQAVAEEETPQAIGDIIYSLLSKPAVGSARIELPILKTDHECDCKEFAQWDGFEVKLRDIKFPLEVTDEQNNEDLRLPSTYWQTGDEVMSSLEKEKLEVSKTTLAYLQNALKNDWTCDEEESLWQAQVIFGKVSLNLQ